MDPFWQNFLRMVGGLAIVSAALPWLLRSLTSHFLSKDVEPCKARLSSEHQTSLERTRPDLRVAARPGQIRCARPHDQKAELIVELYFILLHAWGDISLSRTTCTRRNDANHLIKTHLRQNLQKLNEFFNPKAIFFNRAVSDRLRSTAALVGDTIQECPVRTREGRPEPTNLPTTTASRTDPRPCRPVS